MLSSLSIAYLFLGGTGAGAVLVACLLDMLWAHEPFGAAAPCSLGASSLQHRAIAFTCAAGTLCLIAGSLCLLFDLGSLDRAIFLIQNPSLTYLTFGAVALGLLIACAAFLTLVRFVYVPIIPGVLVVVIESLACVLSLGVMLYTGLLLDSLGSVSVWNTPLVPMLFLLSSASCGIAVALVCAFFDGHAVGGFAVPRILRVWRRATRLCFCSGGWVSSSAELLLPSFWRRLPINGFRCQIGRARRSHVSRLLLCWCSLAVRACAWVW